MSTRKKPPSDGPVRPFADWLREQARGRSHDELSDGLAELTRKVKETEKRGSITYTVSIEPTKGVRGALTVKDEIKVKLPEHERPASLFFSDEHGNLRKDDPNQLSFESLREVPDPAADVDDVTISVLDPATGEVRELSEQVLVEALQRSAEANRPQPIDLTVPERATAAGEGR